TQPWRRPFPSNPSEPHGFSTRSRSPEMALPLRCSDACASWLPHPPATIRVHAVRTHPGVAPFFPHRRILMHFVVVEEIAVHPTRNRHATRLSTNPTQLRGNVRSVSNGHEIAVVSRSPTHDEGLAVVDPRTMTHLPFWVNRIPKESPELRVELLL